MAVLLIVLLPLAVWIVVVSYRRPAYGAAILGFVAPLEKVSIYKGITWKPFLLVFPLVALGLLLRRLRGIEKWPRLSILDKALLVLAAVNLASALSALDPMRTVRMAVQLAILYSITALSVRSIRDETGARIWLFFGFLSGGLVVGYGMFQLLGSFLGINTHLFLRLLPRNPTIPYMLSIPGAVYFPALDRSLPRVGSTFLDWNYFAGYLVFLGAFAVSFLLYRWRNGGRKAHLALLSLGCLILFFFTFSRSGWVGGLVAAGVLYYLLREAFPERKRKILVPLLGVALVAATLVPGSPLRLVVERVEFMFTGDPSVTMHGRYGRAAVQMFQSSPLLGVGLHNYSTAYERFFDPADHGSTAHSTFLSYFAETGIAGGMANIFLHFLVFYLLFRSLRASERFSFAYFGLAASLAGYTGVLAANLFYFFNNQAFIWTFLGYAMAQARLTKGWEPAPAPERNGLHRQTRIP